MAGELDHSDFVDPDFETSGRGSTRAPALSHPILAAPATAPLTAGGGAGSSPSASASAHAPSMRPPSRDDINRQVTAAQQALVELKQRQEELERERTQLEEARRRRLEFEQGREEMLQHLTRGLGLLTDAEQTARRDAEQLSRTLVDLRAAYDKVAALHEESWSADAYQTELNRALTVLENARMEWNSAQTKWPILDGRGAKPGGAPSPGGGPFGGADNEAGPQLLAGRSPIEMARLGLALTWPVAVAVIVVGLILAVALARR